MFTIRQPTEHHARTLDAYTFAVIPENTPFQVYGVSAISDSVIFSALPALVTEVAIAYKIDILQRFSALRSVTLMSQNQLAK